MRTWVLLVVVVAAGNARADDDLGLSLRMRKVSEVEPGEPLLHLDTATPLAADAEGGIMDRDGTVLDIGRLRISGEGRWWQSGLAPSMFADDLPTGGWRAAGELSYDLGWVRVGANTSYGRNSNTVTHKTTGLFVAKNFRLSRWMKAWIMLGFANEQWQLGDQVQRGRSIGLSLGTTFR
jgi:hypothetical protein